MSGDADALWTLQVVFVVAFVLVLVLIEGIAQRRRWVSARMRALAAALPGFAVVTRRSVAGVEGRHRGRAVRVSLGPDLRDRTSVGWQGIVYEVEVPGAADLALNLGADARAWARQGAHAQEALAAIDYLFGIGIERLAVREGRLVARRSISEYALGPERVAQVLDALERLAPLLARRSLTIRVAGAERAGLAWAVGEHVLCPFCRDGLGEDDLVACDACGTVHHAECLAEGGGCSVFACAGRDRGGPERVRSPSG